MTENVWLGVLAVGGGFALLFGLLLIALRAQGQASSPVRARWELALCVLGLAAIVAISLGDWTAVLRSLGAGASWRESGASRLFGWLSFAAVLLRMIWVRLPSLRRAGHRGTSA